VRTQRPAENRQRSSGTRSHTNSRATAGTISSTNAHGSASFAGLAVVVGLAELVAGVPVSPVGSAWSVADVTGVVVMSAGSGVVDRRGPVVGFCDGRGVGARVGGRLITKSDALVRQTAKTIADHRSHESGFVIEHAHAVGPRAIQPTLEGHQRSG